MLTSDTKRHIDNARDILVGVVPNPMAQIDQITNALIYKFMDDMDQAAIAVGGKPSFFVRDLEQYAWTRLMDARIGHQERMNLYAEALVKFSQAKQLPELFRDIFKSAFLPHRSAETLGLFLKEINHFDYSHPEELGNAYEYLLSIMSSQGDAGQFRTPRHIIDFIVAAVAPKKTDKVLDPACGTAGFLISAYNHLLRQSKKKPLTPDERKTVLSNFQGYDIDPTMARIAQVNMYLHQFKNPKIFQYDTLSSEERWTDKFDVILANPPFMTPKGGVRPHNKFSIQARRSEVLFVDYIINHLRPKGRAGVVVPEGIIFQSANAYKELRKNLVNDGLYAVVSLPNGVFNPYSGVKTSILFMDNEVAKRHSEILFVKVESDGFDLGAQRRKTDKDDLPTALDILNKWKTGEKVDSNLAVYVEKARIAGDGEYNLTGERYREVVDYSSAKWPVVELGDVCEIVSGQSPSGEYYNQLQEGEPFYQGKADFQDMYIGEPTKWTTQTTKVAIKDDILMSVRAPVGPVNLATQKICIGRGLAKIRGQSGKLNQKYLFYILRGCEKNIQGNTGATFPSISKRDIQKLKIPLPPLAAQEQIVAEIEQYQKVIGGAKQVVKNWKPSFRIDPDWPMVALETVCASITAGGDLPEQYRKDQKAPTEEFPYPIYSNGTEEKSLYGYTNNYKVESDAVTISARGTIGYHTIRKGKFTPIIRLITLIPNSGAATTNFLNYALDFTDIGYSGNSIPQLTVPNVKKLKIPLPPLKIQERIAAEIEAEQKAVNECKILIGKMEQKIQNAITKLWSE